MRAQQGALAAAALADDHEDLARLHGEVDIPQDGALAEAALDAGDGDRAHTETKSRRHGSARHSMKRTMPSRISPSTA